MSRGPVIAGAVVLAFAWGGPLPGLVAESFTAHMALHMAVVGIGIPLLAIGLAPALDRPSVRRFAALLPRPGLPLTGPLLTGLPLAGLAVAVSLLDLIVVWGWHAPRLHEAARGHRGVLALEQASFAVAALLVWLVAFAAPGARRQEAALAGVMTLFFTAMHMTLLGALIGLGTRPVYGHAAGSGPGAHPGGHSLAHSLADQQLGGAIMLAIGGVVYLGGALVLMARVLRRAPA